jgi:hypothetical protein
LSFTDWATLRLFDVRGHGGYFSFFQLLELEDEARFVLGAPVAANEVRFLIDLVRGRITWHGQISVPGHGRYALLHSTRLNELGPDYLELFDEEDAAIAKFQDMAIAVLTEQVAGAFLLDSVDQRVLAVRIKNQREVLFEKNFLERRRKKQ